MTDAEDQTVNTVDGLPPTAGAAGYSRSEMSDCPRCSKPNPPNRPGCLYCGAEMNLQSGYGENFRIRPSAVEAWERGFNVVHLASDTADPANVIAAVGLDESLLGVVIGSQAKIPLARVSKANEAEAIANRLNSFCVRAAVVPDGELLDSKPTVRLRAIEFGDGRIILFHFNSETTVEIAYADVRTCVIGSIYERRLESTVMKGDKSPLPENETMTTVDYGVIDLYAGENGYRITTNGFDFSCLGSEKSLVAAQNMQQLASRFEEAFTSARFDREYRSLAKSLGIVWPPTSTNDSKGLRRVGFKAQRSKGEIVTNAEQFTKYSRLQALYR